jgi:hypothetical protein
VIPDDYCRRLARAVAPRRSRLNLRHGSSVARIVFPA